MGAIKNKYGEGNKTKALLTKSTDTNWLFLTLSLRKYIITWSDHGKILIESNRYLYNTETETSWGSSWAMEYFSYRNLERSEPDDGFCYKVQIRDVE